MSSASYSPVVKTKQFTCVSQESLYTIAGAYIPSGPSAVQGTFNNTLTQPLTVTISVAAGGTIGSGGPSFNLSGGNLSYLVTISFNRKYSGKIELLANSLDNSPLTGLVSKICNSSIGNPDILDANVEVVGNCLQSALNNPTNPKAFGWSEVDEITSFSFLFTRILAADTVNLSLILTEKSFAKWEKDYIGTTPIWTDPLTNIQYTPALPAGVFEVNCEESTETVSYSKELCYKIGSGISFDYSANPAEAWDAYNGIRPRQDGISSLPFAIGGFKFNEFSPDGKYLYSVSAASFTTHTYTNFALTGVLTIPVNFTGFPAAVGMTPVGLAVHPSTGIIYLSYIDGARRLWLATLSTNGSLQLIGDTQFNSVATVPIDAHDITFTASGQLLLAHGSNLYLVDHTTGVLNSGTPIILTGASTNGFAIRNISRYGNGDLHLSGQDIGLGPIVLLYDGETYTKIRHWASNNSTTPPDSTISTAYPVNPEIKFLRLYVKNIETNSLSIDDRDLITGLPINIPQNAIIKDCSSTVSKITSWTDDLCYVVDTNPISQGMVEIVGGQIVSNAACNPIGGFISPVPVTYSSFTNSISGNAIYALNSGGIALDIYTWNVVNAPLFSSTVLLTGTVGTLKSIRTKWDDGSLWLMSEQTVGANRNYSFYTVNLVSGACTLQNVASYPAGINNNGHFTIGQNNIFYFSYSIGGGIYRISTLSNTTFYIQNFIADVNYVIDNINTDITSNRLILSKSVVSGLDFMSYSGQIIGTCAGAIYADAMPAPLGGLSLGTTIYKLKKVFVKDLVTGDVSIYYHDINTGEDIILPVSARIINCNSNDTSISIPRVRLFTGIVTWSRQIDSPNAKSITVTRIAGNIQLNDNFNISNINAAFSNTWTADKLGGNLQISGTAAGSSFLISSI